MKKWIAVAFLALPCSIEYQINSIRPGAKYVIHSGDYKGIEWLDQSQSKPTQSEMNQALSKCQASLIPANAQQIQADINTINTTTVKTPLEAEIVDLLKQKGLLQ